MLSLTSFVPALCGVQTAPLHPQLGGGGGPQAPPALPVQVPHGDGGGAGEIFVLRYSGQELSRGPLNTVESWESK